MTLLPCMYEYLCGPTLVACRQHTMFALQKHEGSLIFRILIQQKTNSVTADTGTTLFIAVPALL